MSKVTRRSMITSSAALAAAPLALSTTAAAIDPDPVYAAIEAHRRLWREWGEALEAATSREQQAAAEAQGDVVQACLCHLAQTPPTTAGGLAAVLAYVREHQEAHDGEPLFVMASESGDAYSIETWLASLETAALALARA